ncbi:PD-(D/E)XK nuclease superfamily protein [Desulfonatronum zhilinae]|nr:PD-(D/E)XK nuclease superfamily protein [Desulfonatronum zhilinae]
MVTIRHNRISAQDDRDKASFQTVFYLMVSASGVDVRSEVLTCDGRIDLVMHAGETVYIIEFKCNQNADAALRQIRDKGYAQAYRQPGRKVVLLGINFDTGKRNVGEWRMEAEGGSERPPRSCYEEAGRKDSSTNRRSRSASRSTRCIDS